jgi:hypothetical protein
MEEVSGTISEMQQRIASKLKAQFISTGGENTSFQPTKYEKLLDDELYLIIEEEPRTKASKNNLGINKAKDAFQKKRRKEAEKPLYLMRYE